ncbi:MAG: glycosyltransferase family 87 protein [Candidatus Dormibacteria bacterium]
MAVGLAAVAVADYLKEAAADIAGIGHRPLKFDFGQFQRAAMDLSDGRNPYDTYLNMHCHAWCLGGYIYTPLLAEALRPLAHMPLPSAATVWLLLTHLMLVITIAILWRVLRGRTTTAALAMMLAAGLLFQPVYENISYVQIGVLLLLLLTAAAALHLDARPGWNAGSGALIGLASILKLTPVLTVPALMPVGWARRTQAGGRVEGALGVVTAAAAATLLVGVMLVAVPHTADFFTRVLPHIGGGTAVYENKSLPSLVGRVFNAAAELSGRTVRESDVLGPDAKVVALAATALVLGPLVLLAARMVPRPAAEWSARATAFAGFVAAMPIASTITWRHHLVVNLLAMALLLPSLWPLAGRTASRAGQWLVVASYPLTSVPQDLANRAALSGGLDHHSLLYAVRYLAVQDLNLLGMVFLWLACVLALMGLRSPAPAA